LISANRCDDLVGAIASSNKVRLFRFITVPEWCKVDDGEQATRLVLELTIGGD
jgi:hypothetical protein